MLRDTEKQLKAAIIEIIGEVRAAGVTTIDGLTNAQIFRLIKATTADDIELGGALHKNKAICVVDISKLVNELVEEVISHAQASEVLHRAMFKYYSDYVGSIFEKYIEKHYPESHQIH